VVVEGILLIIQGKKLLQNNQFSQIEVFLFLFIETANGNVAMWQKLVYHGLVVMR